MKNVILTHANCPDGFAAAWVARNYFGKDEVEVHFCSHDMDPPLDDCRGRAVFMTDLCFNKVESMRALAEAADFLVVLDHHKTAKPVLDELQADEALRLKVRVTFDNDRSGARLAWDHFFPGRPVPTLVAYVEDRDLWRWALPRSKEVNACLSSYTFNFDKWTEISFKTAEELADEGAAILRYKDREVNSLVQRAREVVFHGHNVLAVNATTLISEVAGELAKGRPFGIAWFERQDGNIQVSLRSREGGIDVSGIAKEHGGGGHAAAAGYVAAELPF